MNLLLRLKKKKTQQFRLNLMSSQEPANDNNDFGDTERILQAYQKDNEQLHLRVKDLEKQISTNETDVRKENEALRRQILELRNNQITIDNYQELQEEHVHYVRETKQRIMTLEEENQILRIENEKLINNQKRWDQDDTRNQSIESVISSLREAFIQGKDIEQAFDNLAAIICPEILVRREKEVSSLKSNQRSRYRSPSRIDPSSLEIKRLKEEIESLKSTVEELQKAKKNPPKRTGIPSRPSTQQSNKIKELEQQVAEYQRKCEDMEREISSVKGRSKDRNGRIKELQTQATKAQEDLMEEQKRHQIDINEFTIQKAQMEAQLKALQTNADYRSECETFRARVQILEAENAELKKPRPTGNAALDKVLDAIARMEGDIQQRQMDLNRMALKLEDKFEEERRQLENNHKREMEEKCQQIKRYKHQFEAILADLDKSKRKKP